MTKETTSHSHTATHGHASGKEDEHTSKEGEQAKEEAKTLTPDEIRSLQALVDQAAGGKPDAGLVTQAANMLRRLKPAPVDHLVDAVLVNPGRDARPALKALWDALFFHDNYQDKGRQVGLAAVRLGAGQRAISISWDDQ
jgi:hypothetical protein